MPNQHTKAEALKAYQWRPGTSGNPGGRPKTRVVSDLLRQLFDIPVPESIRKKLNRNVGGRRGLGIKKGETFGGALVVQMYLRAIGGDAAMAKVVVAFIEGYPERRLQANVEVSNANENIHAIRTRLLNMFANKNSQDGSPQLPENSDNAHHVETP